MQGFIARLRTHLVRRLNPQAIANLDEVPPHLVDDLDIRDDRLYRHRVVRFNYTSYDMRREQDSVNPRTHPDIMLLDPDSTPGALPYTYARVVGIFHAYARYTGPDSTPAMRRLQRIDMLWVRWYQLDNHAKSPFHHRRQPRLQFMDAHDPNTAAFDFVDPHVVLRAAYIMPAFYYGTTTEFLEHDGSVGWHPDDGDEDYLFYYASM